MAVIGTPVLAALTLYYGGSDLPGAWVAAHGGGRPGILTVTSQSCSYHALAGDMCHGAYGEFFSDDGALHVHHAFLDGLPNGVGAGSRLPVRYVSGRQPPVVYPATGSREWWAIGGFVMAAASALVIWGLTLRAKLLGEHLPWMIRPLPQPHRQRSQRADDKIGHTGSGQPRKRR